MVKRSLIAIMAIAGFAVLSISCQKSGKVSVEELKAETEDVVFSKHGKAAFEVTSIENLPVKQGHATIVTYRLENGITGSYALISNASYKLVPGGGKPVIQKRKYGKNNDSAARIIITCEQGSTCQCKLSATVDTDTGEIAVSCGCSTCEVRMVEE